MVSRRRAEGMAGMGCKQPTLGDRRDELSGANRHDAPFPSSQTSVVVGQSTWVTANAGSPYFRVFL